VRGKAGNRRYSKELNLEEQIRCKGRQGYVWRVVLAAEVKG
jgi:hypothetical protein